MKLSYFNAYGRAEPSRLLLNWFKIDFEDERIEFKDWPEVKNDKERFPLGQMPVLSHDGKVYTNSAAILKYLGAQHGAFPTDADSLYEVEKLLDLMTDFWTPIVAASFGPGTPEEKAEKFGELVKSHFPKFFGIWNDHIKNGGNKEFLVGDSITVADFAYLHTWVHFRHGEKTKDALADLFAAFPDFDAWGQTRYEAQKEYFDARPKCDF